MKLIFAFLFSLITTFSLGQAINGRTNGTYTPLDSNLFVGKSFRVPAFADTLTANGYKTLDSAGKIIYTYDINGFWFRSNTPRRWERLNYGNTTQQFPDGFVSEVNGIGLVDSTVTLRAPIVIRRNNKDTTITTDQVFVINSIDTGYVQHILIYEALNGSVSAILGVPDTVNAVLPAMPIGGIQLTTITVNGRDPISKPVPSITYSFWSPDGNNITSSDRALLGTLNARALNIITSGQVMMFVDSLNRYIDIKKDLYIGGSYLFMYGNNPSINFEPHTGLGINLNHEFNNSTTKKYGLSLFGQSRLNLNGATDKSYSLIKIDPLITDSLGNVRDTIILVHITPTVSSIQGTKLYSLKIDSGYIKIPLPDTTANEDFFIVRNSATGEIMRQRISTSGGSPTIFYADSLTGQYIDSASRIIYNGIDSSKDYNLVNWGQFNRHNAGGGSWSVTGNTGLTGGNYLGTNSDTFSVKTNNKTSLYIDNSTSNQIGFGSDIFVGSSGNNDFISIGENNGYNNIGRTSVIGIGVGNNSTNSNDHIIGIGESNNSSNQGSHIISIGEAVGNSNPSASSFNIGIGFNHTLFSFLGTDAIAIGRGALDVGVGINTIGIGKNAGVGGANDGIFIGYNTKANALNNVVAIGANAYVEQDNSIVLGGIDGVNGSTTSTNVGIGTTTPLSALHVSGNGFNTALFTNGSVGIGPASIEQTAILDINSTTQGLLIPRMTNTERDAIVDPATSLLIFQTDGTIGYYYYDGAAWVALSGGGSGTVTSVATGYGLSGGTITTTGTLLVDSSALSLKYLRRGDSVLNTGWTSLYQRNKLKDSLQTNIDLKANIASPAFTGSVTNARVTTSQMNAIASPVSGMQVWNTDEDAFFTYSTLWGWESQDFNWQLKNELIYKNDFTATMSTPSVLDAMIVINGTLTSNPVATEGNRPGILSLSTSTSATGATSVGTGNGTTTQPILLGGGKLIYEASVRIPTLSTGTERFTFVSGITSTNNAAGVSNGLMFIYDSSGVATATTGTPNWKVQTVATSSPTTTVTSVAVAANTWYTLRIIDNAANSSVDYYINGTLVRTETATIPTVAMGFTNRITKSIGTTARTVEIDYLSIKQKFTTAR